MKCLLKAKISVIYSQDIKMDDNIIRLYIFNQLLKQLIKSRFFRLTSYIYIYIYIYIYTIVTLR